MTRMFRLVKENALCTNCFKSVSLQDLMIWVHDSDPWEVHMVHRTEINPECEPTIIKFLTDLYPDKIVFVETLDDAMQIYEEEIEKSNFN